MLGRLYPGQDCALARALELIGERWTLLIVRDARFRGSTRFGDFQSSLGIASNILSRRLEHLIEVGVMTFDPATGAYGLSESGQELLTVAMAATEWGEKWVAPGPIEFVHGPASAPVRTALVDAQTGAPVDRKAISVRRRR
ncbi:MAG: helix-turn-helix domain-containing protein [Croceibacterium sp.]